jgi:hypothetical protein
LSLQSKRLRFTPIALATGLIAAGLLSLSMTGTLSGFVASITNNQNTAATGAIVMEETTTTGTPATCTSTDSGTVSTNASTCSTINTFGGSTVMVPGSAVTTGISIKNVGTVTPSSFTMTHGPSCTQSNNGSLNGTATDLCSKINIVITSGSTTVFTGTVTQLALATASSSPAITMPAAPAAGVSVPFSITATLDSDAGNTYQGLAVSLPITFTFTS